jgi:hypothetical protein
MIYQFNATKGISNAKSLINEIIKRANRDYDTSPKFNIFTPSLKKNLDPPII